MDEDTERFIESVELMIENDELPEPLNDVFGFLDLKELVTRVYEEAFEAMDYPADGTPEEQGLAIREFVERVGMKVGVITALASNTSPDSIKVQLPTEELVQTFTQLIRGGKAVIEITT